MWIYQKGLCLLMLSASALTYPPGDHIYAPAHEEYQPKDYSFSYGVKDYHTGDIKQQWEKKTGDKVTGHYSLVESDGSIRSVDYTADKKSGFNAVVKHTGLSHHPSKSKDHSVSHSEVNLKPKETQAANHKYEPQEPQYQIKWIYPDGSEASSEAIEAAKHQQEVDEHSYLAEQEYGSVQGYEYHTPEETVEESQDSAVKSEYHYKKPHQNDVRPQFVFKDQYESLKQQLPVDLSLLKANPAEEILPVDVSVVKPVEVDVKENIYPPLDFQSKYLQQEQYSVKETQPTTELSREELKKFLQEYYSKAKNQIIEPDLETGFKPIRNKPSAAITRPLIPGTYKSNKKPMTTPGLSTYSSSQYRRQPNNKYNSGLPKVGNFEGHRGSPKVPYRYYNVNRELSQERQKSDDNNRLYRSLANSASGYVRYARNIPHERSEGNK